jgi:hypothetical protein
MKTVRIRVKKQPEPEPEPEDNIQLEQVYAKYLARVQKKWPGKQTIHKKRKWWLGRKIRSEQF